MGSFEDHRDHAIGRVRDAYVRGALSTGTFERRIDASMRAASTRALRELLWDLGSSGDMARIAAARGRYVLDVLANRIPPAETTVTVDLPDVAGHLDRGTWTIGRSSTCDIALDSSQSVSRLHADLSLRGGAWHLRDRGSSNGTWVGARRITQTRLDPKLPTRLGCLDVWWSFD